MTRATRGRYAIPRAAQRSDRHERGDDGDERANRDWRQGVAQPYAHHPTAERAERDAHADLARSARHDVRQHAVDAQRCEQQSERCKAAQNEHREPSVAKRSLANFHRRLDAREYVWVEREAARGPRGRSPMSVIGALRWLSMPSSRSRRPSGFASPKNFFAIA